MSKDKVIVLRGELNWAKLLGDPRPHTGNPKYDKGPYWSVDLTPDERSLNDLKTFGVEGKLREPREKDLQKTSFLTLRVLANRANGEKNSPPNIKDVQGQPWGTELIGNGTIGDVKVKIVDYGKGVDKGMYLQALRVLKHIPYEREEFEPLSEDDEFFAAPEEASKPAPEQEDDLDDDVPY